MSVGSWSRIRVSGASLGEFEVAETAEVTDLEIERLNRHDGREHEPRDGGCEAAGRREQGPQA